MIAALLHKSQRYELQGGKNMSHSVTDNRKFIEDYLQALSGRPKTKELVAQYVSDAALCDHIQAVEAAFPCYQLHSERMVIEGDLVALQATFRGKHLDAFAGFEPTGKTVSAGLMIFYRLEDGRIAEHWMQFDNAGLMAQLTEAAALTAA
jgi:predicted ester cyclase